MCWNTFDRFIDIWFDRFIDIWFDRFIDIWFDRLIDIWFDRFIDNWLKYFSKDQLKFVDGNLLISAPYQVMEEIQTFLGVRQYITKGMVGSSQWNCSHHPYRWINAGLIYILDFFQFNEQKGFYCYKNSSKQLECLEDTKGRPHPAMNPATRAKLVEYFAPRNAIFFSKIDRTFDWDWTVLETMNQLPLPNDLHSIFARFRRSGNVVGRSSERRIQDIFSTEGQVTN